MSTDSLKVLARARINSRPLSRKRKTRRINVTNGTRSNETLQDDESCTSSIRPREKACKWICFVIDHRKHTWLTEKYSGYSYEADRSDSLRYPEEQEGVENNS